MVAYRDFLLADESDSNDTDAESGLMAGLWCQTANTSSATLGSWQFPNGSLVPTTPTNQTIHTAHLTGQVGLQLDNSSSGLLPINGMYTCTIPDEDGVHQTLVVWAGSDEAYDGFGTARELSV